MSATTTVLKTDDGQMDLVCCRPDGRPGPWPAIILYMDAMGVRPELIGMAERLSNMGFMVALPNLFYRSGPQPPVDTARFVQPGPERDRVFALIQSVTHEMIMRDTRAILDLLDKSPDVKGPSVGTLGYCMGGGFALTAAGTFPSRVVAAASFHGGWLATDKADSPHRLAPQMRARLYVGVAGIDPMFPPEECERLRAALDAAGCGFELKVYEGVRHGFSVTGHPVYDRAASEEHWQVLGRLFPEALKA